MLMKYTLHAEGFCMHNQRIDYVDQHLNLTFILYKVRLGCVNILLHKFASGYDLVNLACEMIETSA